MVQQKLVSNFASVLVRLVIVFAFGFSVLSPAVSPARADPPGNSIFLPVIMRLLPETWLDHIIFSAVPNYATAVSQLQAGTINMYPVSLSDPTLYNQVKTTPGLKTKTLSGGSDQLLFNTVQCSNPAILNPFHDMKIREAMNWAVDRNYITQEIMGGLATPAFTAFEPAFPDHQRYNSIFGPLEAKYAYDLSKAQGVVDTEMPLMGAVKGSNGKWQFNGQPVVIIGLIRLEDSRKQLGEYFADQLETLGFTVDRQEKIRADAAPIWQGDPYPCSFNYYTAGWINTSIVRDEGLNFAEFNSGLVMGLPVMNAYQPSLALAAAENALLNLAFTSLAQRADLFQTALTLSMQESWWGIWTADPTSFEPYQDTLAVASDVAGGIGGPMWPYTLHFTGQTGGTVKIGQQAVLVTAWNPISGSNWTDDQTVIAATMDRGLVPDPNTGLNLPVLVQSASVVAQTGLVIFNSSNWLSLTTQDTIAVPPDAWADWNASSQTFITAQQRAANDPNYHLTANIKTSVTYIPNLWYTKWHDGSNLSAADFVMAMIMKFDPGKPASKIYDPGYTSTLQSFMSHFKGVRITSTDPLTIETYEDAYGMDAENNLTTWYPAEPTYAYGTGAWHNLAPAIQAEADGVLAFSYDKASNLHINQTSLISGPTLAVQANYLNSLTVSNAIPYAPTLGSYVTPAEAAARYTNLKAWYLARGNLWIGTGPYYVDQVNSGNGTVSLAHFSDYMFGPRFWNLAQ